jgi:rhamnosyltransferase
MAHKVLVLLAVYNGEKWLREQIETILYQKDVNVTLLASDDGSSDCSLSILNSFSSDRVIVINNKNNSGSAAKNFINLIINSDPECFDFMALSDQDDIWVHTKIINGIRSISDSHTDAYSSAVHTFGKFQKKIIQNNKIRSADFIFEGAGQGCTFILTKESYCKIQKFIINNFNLIIYFHFHDWLLYLLIRNFKMSWYFDPNGYIMYRQHEANEIGARGSLISFYNRLLLIKSGWYSRQIGLALIISWETGSFDQNLRLFTSIFFSKPRIFRQIMISKFILSHGRRRFSDRFFLALFALFYWI